MFTILPGHDYIWSCFFRYNDNYLINTTDDIWTNFINLASTIRGDMYSSMLQVSSTKTALSMIFENFLIAVASLFVILFIISCIVNIVFCNRYFILRKRSKNQSNPINWSGYEIVCIRWSISYCFWRQKEIITTIT